ncbi:MAG: hypothetical protein AB7S99_18745 [Pseudodonghicola sp.]
MRDPLEELLRMHRAAAAFGCGLNPALLTRIEQRSRKLAAVRAQPNVVTLGTASSQSGPPQSVCAGRIEADDTLLPFPRRAR